MLHYTQLIKGGIIMQKSYFDGGMLTYILSYIISFFIITLTFGLGTPWAICIMYKWEIEHTVIEGRRLGFDGTALELFGNWIKWFFLCIITLGIYGFWIHIKVLEWKANHTYFLD